MERLIRPSAFFKVLLLGMPSKSLLKILVLGDIVARIGREAVIKLLPQIIKEEGPDLVIANAENLTHGKGINRKSFEEMRKAGITAFTSGNHIWNKPDGVELLANPNNLLLRPANYPDSNPGKGYQTVTVGSHEILIINLMGRAFMRESLSCPFAKLDEILLKYKGTNLSAILVDFHAEATSERAAFGWYADGRISAVWGTHTHIPTNDGRILTNDTAYITDVGMTGAYNSVLGVEKSRPIKGFLTQLPQRFEYPEEGEAILNAIIITIDSKDKKAQDIKTIQKIVTIK